jgi:5-methyltetrahydropteroyltriglutamate--homocysteine methyltransferase
MREEYTAIIESGLGLQLDDPAIAENWDQINPAPTVEEYRRFTRLRIEALNHAIRGLPSERIRFHLCWGSWHGPHTTDIPMADIVDLMLEVNAGAYSFEAANVRHAHEWKVWRDVRLPDGKVILPGVVSHSTNVIEHPELVAERIIAFAEGVGRRRPRPARRGSACRACRPRPGRRSSPWWIPRTRRSGCSSARPRSASSPPTTSPGWPAGANGSR